MLNSNEFEEALNFYKEAKANYERVHAEFSDNDDLLNLYLPSAHYIYESAKESIVRIFEQKTGIEVNRKETIDADIWIRFNGEQFSRGRGPISFIGKYLSKLNDANKHATSLICGRHNTIDPKCTEIPAFDLIATAAGSLKLGLKLPDQEPWEPEELQPLFENPWNKLEQLVKKKQLALEGLKLLINMLSLPNDRSMIQQLGTTYTQDEIIKLIHYTKDLAPSRRSNVDNITFSIVDNNSKRISVEVSTDTRKILNDYAKSLINNAEYITAKAFFVVLDFENKTAAAKPLIYNGKRIDNISCSFTRLILSDDFFRQLGNNLVSISGYLYFDKNNEPEHIEVDNINIVDQEENAEE